MGKILRISRKLNFTLNTLGCHGLTTFNNKLGLDFLSGQITFPVYRSTSAWGSEKKHSVSLNNCTINVSSRQATFKAAHFKLMNLAGQARPRLANLSRIGHITVRRSVGWSVQRLVARRCLLGLDWPPTGTGSLSGLPDRSHVRFLFLLEELEYSFAF